MSQVSELPPSLTVASAKVPPGATVNLQLSLRNQMNEIVLLHPTLDDWESDRGQIFSTLNRLVPSYIYLARGMAASQTLTLEMPAELPVGQSVKTWLRFPGLQETAILIQIEITAPSQQLNKNWPVNVPLQVTLPLPGETDRLSSSGSDAANAGIFGLIAGLIDLEKIPSSWLVAELLAILAQKGEEYARTPAGSKLLDRLKKTQFFQKGAIATATAHLPEWIAQNLSNASAVLDSQVGQGYLLEIWQRWLLSLVHADLEANALSHTITPPPLLAKGFTAEMGSDAKRWFGAIALGLACLSPRIAGILKEISDRAWGASAIFGSKLLAAKADAASYDLAAALPGFDALPARWLAAELLLLLALLGEERARTEEGSQLLRQLGSTRFFKNGVLALAAASAPRWLAVTQSAASAYHASVGGQPGEEGLLHFWEQWLWNLAEAELEAGGLRRKIQIPDFSGGALVAALGMNGDRWFGALVLGLARLSPALAAVLEAIAPNARAPQPAAPVPVFDDVLGEGRSIQR